jgi:hypothetical protein
VLNLNVLRYTAGSDQRFPFQMTFDLWKAKFTPQRSDIVTRFIEFWCQKNCKHGWRIEEHSKELKLYFEHTRDYVLFKISAEYSIF